MLLMQDILEDVPLIGEICIKVLFKFFHHSEGEIVLVMSVTLGHVFPCIL